MKKDIDTLKKRSRRRRDVVEQAGSASLALSGLVGMFFLVVLVWQIAIPTFIDGENGEISAASEFIPISDYVLEWDHPNVNEQGDLKTEPIVLTIKWEGQTGAQTHDLEIVVTANRGEKEDVQISEEGLSTTSIEVGKKTKFYLKSVLDVPVSVEQRSGPVPAADASGNPHVSSFVVSGDVAVLISNGSAVFEPLEMAGWTSLLVLTFIVSRPTERRLAPLVRCYGRERQIRGIILLLAIFTIVIGQTTLSAFLGGLCWLLFGVALLRTIEGMERLQNQGRSLTEVKRLKHSISDREGLLLWSRMLLVSACFFIPLDIDIPFLTERYQDIFQPYASGIRSAFFGTVWVMS
ncbi:MAG: hypothetical protein ACPG83_07825, partial [Candidatus Poseidoniaceae archaeon]